MKRPEKKYFEKADKNYQNVYDNERYEEHLNAYIDYLEKQLQKERIINLSLIEQLNERQGKK